MERTYLIRIRKQRGETQQAAADALGITRQYYALIEDGARQKRMDIVFAEKLSKHFGVPLNDIFDFERALSATPTA